MTNNFFLKLCPNEVSQSKQFIAPVAEAVKESTRTPPSNMFVPKQNNIELNTKNMLKNLTNYFYCQKLGGIPELKKEWIRRKSTAELVRILEKSSDYPTRAEAIGNNLTIQRIFEVLHERKEIDCETAYCFEQCEERKIF